MKTIPFFEVNGNRYEIKMTRYLLVEYDKLRDNVNVSAEDKEKVLYLQKVVEDLTKYAKKLKELEERFFETFDAEDERKYRLMKGLYDETYKTFTELTSTNALNNAHKERLYALEATVIVGLAEQYFNFNKELAKETWQSYLASVDATKTIDQWLMAFGEYLDSDTEEEGKEETFLSKLKAEREQQELNRRNGMHR